MKKIHSISMDFLLVMPLWGECNRVSLLLADDEMLLNAVKALPLNKGKVANYNDKIVFENPFDGPSLEFLEWIESILVHLGPNGTYRSVIFPLTQTLLTAMPDFDSVLVDPASHLVNIFNGIGRNLIIQQDGFYRTKRILCWFMGQLPELERLGLVLRG